MYRDAEVVARGETEFFQRTVFLRPRGGLWLVVFEEAWGGTVKRARLTEDVARVDGTEFLLRVATARGGVGEDGAEGVACEGVTELGRAGGGRAEGGQYFSERRVFPGRIELRSALA